METRIEKEKTRGAKLKQKVQFLSSLNTEDQVRQHEMLDVVFDVYSNCIIIPFFCFVFCTNMRKENMWMGWIETTLCSISLLDCHAGFNVGISGRKGGRGAALPGGGQVAQSNHP